MQRLTLSRCTLAALCVWLALALPAVAYAKRLASAGEFGAIARAVAENPDGDYFCPSREAVWVSTTDSRWAVAVMRSNCGVGSQTVRFFVHRNERTSKRWKLRERKYERLGTGLGIPCGSRRVPSDIRCARLRR